MRIALVVTVVVGALLVLWAAPASGQDSTTGGLKPDLPLGFPTPRSADPYKQRPDDLGDGKSPKKSGTDDAVAGGKTKKPGTVDPGDDAPNKPGTVDPGDDAPNKPGTVDPGDDAPNKPGTVDPGDDAPNEPGTEEPPVEPGEEGENVTRPGEESGFGPPREEGREVPPEERAVPPTEEGTTLPPPPEEGTTAPPVEEGADTPPLEEGSNTPPEEEGPRVPPPEFFDEPVEEAEVIFVIDRTGSMRWASNMSVVDENGTAVNNCRKYDVARIELIKAVNNLAENVKFAIVGFSTGGRTSSYTDANWTSSGGGRIQGRWNSWPPRDGRPTPLGLHRHDRNNLPVWPTASQLMPATDANKSSAVTWSKARLSNSEVTGGTCTYDGMSIALKMVSPPPPGVGPGGEKKKSATGLYLLTDGSPTHIETLGYCFLRVWGSYDAGEVAKDCTYTEDCMALTKAKILAENVHNARIYTLGMGMNMACPNAYVWNPQKNDWDYFPALFNDKCRQFLTELAEATGGHYREVSQ